MPTMIYENTIYCGIEKCCLTRLTGYFGTSYYINTDEGVPEYEQIFYPALKVYPSNFKISEIKKSYPDHFIFSFIRNPYDRIISNYHFNLDNWRYNKSRTREWPDFLEYCQNMKDWNVLPRLVDHLDIHIDFIGRFERLKTDFNKLHKILGIKMVKEGKKHPLDRISNYSPRKKTYRNYYNEETKEIIKKMYAEDLATFNYKF